ncbi:MAG: alpha-2-macroglobulin, partial [Flavobacteriales bacterium]
DAMSMQPIDKSFFKSKISNRDFSAKPGQSTLLQWDIEIPEGIGAVVYRVVARAGKFSDGEETAVPVLSNRMLVTETMPMPIRGEQTKAFTFEKLLNSGNSGTLKNHKLTLEFTSNPAWYAIQALPFIMEYPYECSEQTFSRFYANSIASHIANSHPRIKRVFDAWKSQNPAALLSNLEKNRELKSLILEETPWVLDAQDESERKKRVGLLFDLNRMGNELGTALRKLEKSQASNGGWPWFLGMPESRYITQHIVAGFGHLDKLGVKDVRENRRTWQMIAKAVPYLDNRLRDDYRWLIRHKLDMKKNHLSYTQIQYLYARSFFTDIRVASRNKEAFEYFKGQAKQYWLENSRYMQGMIALALHRFGDKITPIEVLNSLRENAIFNEEMGMYWKENVPGYYWYQAPVEMHALLIEAFDEIAHDSKSVEEMRIWLLKQKQTQDWRTTRATADACYALLLSGTEWLDTENIVQIKMGDLQIDPGKMDDVQVEAGTGYFKTSWSKTEIKPQMGNVTVTKPGKGIAWGALYWQYFEQLDKITPHKTPLQLEKKLFLEQLTDGGKVLQPVTVKTKLKPGDKVTVRIVLRSDRHMEYLHLKDMRAAGFEPINILSSYKYQDGLGYYESTKDASTNFFIEYLPKGTYVFEYPLRVTHKGDFSNGISSVQCMYAPEFASHSEGIRVHVGK